MTVFFDRRQSSLSSLALAFVLDLETCLSDAYEDRLRPLLRLLRLLLRLLLLRLLLPGLRSDSTVARASDGGGAAIQGC